MSVLEFLRTTDYSSQLGLDVLCIHVQLLGRTTFDRIFWKARGIPYEGQTFDLRYKEYQDPFKPGWKIKPSAGHILDYPYYTLQSRSFWSFHIDGHHSSNKNTSKKAFLALLLALIGSILLLLLLAVHRIIGLLTILLPLSRIQFLVPL